MKGTDPGDRSGPNRGRRKRRRRTPRSADRSRSRWPKLRKGRLPPEAETRERSEVAPVSNPLPFYARIVFMIGPEANQYITVSHPHNFHWREGSLGDLIPLLGDGLLTIDGGYHDRARRIMIPPSTASRSRPRSRR